jgi:hypothetical protein
MEVATQMRVAADANAAADVDDHVLPRVPYRQWVFTFPIPLPRRHHLRTDKPSTRQRDFRRRERHVHDEGGALAGHRQHLCIAAACSCFRANRAHAHTATR